METADATLQPGLECYQPRGITVALSSPCRSFPAVNFPHTHLISLRERGRRSPNRWRVHTGLSPLYSSVRPVGGISLLSRSLVPPEASTGGCGLNLLPYGFPGSLAGGSPSLGSNPFSLHGTRIPIPQGLREPL